MVRTRENYSRDLSRSMQATYILGIPLNMPRSAKKFISPYPLDAVQIMHGEILSVRAGPTYSYARCLLSANKIQRTPREILRVGVLRKQRRVPVKNLPLPKS
jgi:hypothetical protein